MVSFGDLSLHILVMKRKLLYLCHFNAKLFICPDHPNKCWLQSYEVPLSPGHSYSHPGDCVQYNCADDFSYSAETCAPVHVEDFNCRSASLDPQAAFPVCCPQLICD